MITPQQCRAARASLGWKLADLAKACDVGVTAINRWETGRTAEMHKSNVEAIERALTAAGTKFAPGWVKVSVDA